MEELYKFFLFCSGTQKMEYFKHAIFFLLIYFFVGVFYIISTWIYKYNIISFIPHH